MTPIEKLQQLENKTSTSAEAMDFFDSLPAAGIEGILGRWKGKALHTGHELDGLLESYGWFGKEFRGLEEVHPLLFESADGEVYPVNPSYVPVNLMMDHIQYANNEFAAKTFRLLGKGARSDKPHARIRRLEHRGVVTTAMIYDTLPIIDIFRQIDENTLLGMMDLRDNAPSFFFILRRTVV